MTSVPPILTDFVATAPAYVTEQAEALEWLADVHAAAEVAAHGFHGDARARFRERLSRAIDRCACKPSQIARRGHSNAELAARGQGGELYDVRQDPRGSGWPARTRVFERVVDAYFTKAFDGEPEPRDIVHVTCTGYASPSAAQKLVSARNWSTRVTHAYHMGCYAAVPALRIASGFVASGSRQVDIVHTELCSLHLDPSDHRLEQLVIQSLFADGLIRYRMVPSTRQRGLRVLAVAERIVPESSDAMTWKVSESGMAMSLARDVPQKIAQVLRGFVSDLLGETGRTIASLREVAVAVHPGGPKIIDGVRDTLELWDEQVAISREVLRDHGNMSSATLPHIWQRMIEDERVPVGTIIPSLAFGPGLTICGALLEKV